MTTTYGTLQSHELAEEWRQLRRRGSEHARARLIDHYRYLVVKTRQRIVPSVPIKISAEDLEQEGMIALVKAVDRFDPLREVKFESFAISLIRGAMLEYLRKEDWIPRSVRTKQKTIKAADEALALLMGTENVTDQDRADWLGLSLDDFYVLYAAACIMQIVGLEDIVGDTEHEDLDALMVLDSVRSKEPDPHTLVVARERAAVLTQWLAWLPCPERDVLHRYYFEGMTLKQIAQDLQRSESRAHQLHAQGIVRLYSFAVRDEDGTPELGALRRSSQSPTTEWVRVPLPEGWAPLPVPVREKSREPKVTTVATAPPLPAEPQPRCKPKRLRRPRPDDHAVYLAMIAPFYTATPTREGRGG